MGAPIQDLVRAVIVGREAAYSSQAAISMQMERLIEYAVINRDPRDVRPDEIQTSNLIAQTLVNLGFQADANIGRDLWELVSEDSQAQWLMPPESIEGVHISLINVANNMASGKCYIEFV